MSLYKNIFAPLCITFHLHWLLFQSTNRNAYFKSSHNHKQRWPSLESFCSHQNNFKRIYEHFSRLVNEVSDIFGWDMILFNWDMYDFAHCFCDSPVLEICIYQNVSHCFRVTESSEIIVYYGKTGWARVFVCVEVLRPSQPSGVMSSAVSLPNHTFAGQA